VTQDRFQPQLPGGQMHSSLIAVVLCMSAQASVACIPAADAAQQSAAPTKVQVVQTQTATPAMPGAGLITTAAAGTRDAPALRPAPRAGARPDEDRPRRAGPAMLLAALALMCAIALRRYGAGSQ
ncbi:MAG TPA: hypothetical protein VKP68_17635, partial [Ramlibacter sp.]|nr:hypothetical protein [Ramlibacter sp.]